MKIIVNSPNNRFKNRRRVYTELDFDKLPKEKKELVEKSDYISRTDQSQSQQTDVNYIYNKHLKGQSLFFTEEEKRARANLYADLTQLPDLGEAMNVIHQAGETFMTIDPKLRARFENSPQKFIEFLNDPSNDIEAVKLGFKVARRMENLDNPAQQAPANPPQSSRKNKQPPLPLVDSDEE